jgi:hypothetical protein
MGKPKQRASFGRQSYRYAEVLPSPIGCGVCTFHPAHLSFPLVQRPHPPALPKIGTGILRQRRRGAMAHWQLLWMVSGEEIKTLFLII